VLVEGLWTSSCLWILFFVEVGDGAEPLMMELISARGGRSSCYRHCQMM
jgi:hypothetical protein